MFSFSWMNILYIVLIALAVAANLLATIFLGLSAWRLWPLKGDSKWDCWILWLDIAFACVHLLVLAAGAVGVFMLLRS